LVQGVEQLKPTEIRYRMFNGRLATVETVSAPLTWRGRSANLVMLRDVTERIRVQKTLKESEHRFRDFASSASDWMWETDQNHRNFWISDNVFQRSGLSRVALIGKYHWELDGIESGGDVIQRALETRQPFRDVQYSRTDSSGRCLYRRTNGNPVQDDLLQPGSTFESYLRARFDTGMYKDFVEGSAEDWIAERMARHRDPKGAVFTLFVNGRWRRVREERLPGGSTLEIGTDITEEKLANLALQNSEAQMRLVTDNIPAFVSYLDRA
jgi:PAS domain S-box-containing protein